MINIGSLILIALSITLFSSFAVPLFLLIVKKQTTLSKCVLATFIVELLFLIFICVNSFNGTEAFRQGLSRYGFYAFFSSIGLITWIFRVISLFIILKDFMKSKVGKIILNVVIAIAILISLWIIKIVL